MTQKEDIAERVREIRRLADEALKIIGGRTGSMHEEKTKSRATRSFRNTLPDHILPLREEGFFRQPRTAPEIHKKLQGVYPCDLNRVEVALYRLHKKRLLRRTSKGTGESKQVAYAW